MAVSDVATNELHCDEAPSFRRAGHAVFGDKVIPIGHTLVKLASHAIAIGILVLAGIFLQSTRVFPALDPGTPPNTDRLYVRGWPYVAELAVITRAPNSGQSWILPTDRLFSFDQFALNISITAGLVLLCYVGIAGLILPKFPKYDWLDLLALATGIALAFTYVSGLSPGFLKTAVPLGFWIREITIFDRPFLQKIVLALFIILTTFTLISLAASALRRFPMERTSRDNSAIN